MKALVSPLFYGPEVDFSNQSMSQCATFDSIFGDKMYVYQNQAEGCY